MLNFLIIGSGINQVNDNYISMNFGSFILLIIFILSLFFLYYCYLRAIKKKNHRNALRNVLKYFCAVLTSILLSILVVYCIDLIAKALPNNNSKDNNDKILFWLLDVIVPIFYGFVALIVTIVVIIVLRYIIKNRYGQNSGRAAYFLWIIGVIMLLFCLFFFCISWLESD